MSFLTSQFGASGPLLDILIGVSAPRRRLLEGKGLQPPPALRLTFIIDTGADTTMLNDQHMRTLGIPVRGKRDILTATTGHEATACSTYDVELQIVTFGDPPLIIPALEVLGRPLFNHSIDGMIGRDVLERVVLTVDGPGRRFRIQY